MIPECKLPSCSATDGRQGAYSSARPLLRPQEDSGSPACELPLDRASAFAPSSTTAPPACGPLQLWPRRGASWPSVGHTPGPSSYLLVLRWPRPAPGAIVRTGSLLADGSQPPLLSTGSLRRIQTQVADPTARVQKPLHLSHGQHRGQGNHRTHSRMCG